MAYIYNDEDNVPMSEDPWLKYTTYSCKAEADAWENGDIDRQIEAMETAREIRECQIREGFLDDLEIPRDSECRDCAWMQEGIIDQFEADDDLMLPGHAYDTAKRMCEWCKSGKDMDEFFEREDEE